MRENLKPFYKARGWSKAEKAAFQAARRRALSQDYSRNWRLLHQQEIDSLKEQLNSLTQLNNELRTQLAAYSA